MSPESAMYQTHPEEYSEMKIIQAIKEGDLSFVQVSHNGVTVDIQKAGSLASITTKGRGNVRFAKSQAKLISQMING